MERAGGGSCAHGYPSWGTFIRQPTGFPEGPFFLRSDPGFAPASLSIGAIREFQRRLDEATEAYRTALRYDPDSRDARACLARVQASRGPRATVGSSSQ